MAMDTLSHYLWAVALYWYFRKPRHWLSGLSGALPDLLSFGLLFVMAHLGMTAFEPGGPPPIEHIPDFIFTLYNVTHSLIPIGMTALLLFFLARRWWFLTWGWLLGILMDIPTHTQAYFPTPFLWPLSSYTFDGFSWGQSWFMLLNYSLLFVAFGLLWWRDSTGSACSQRNSK